jgi:hypothetical protein
MHDGNPKAHETGFKRRIQADMGSALGEAFGAEPMGALGQDGMFRVRGRTRVRK